MLKRKDKGKDNPKTIINLLSTNPDADEKSGKLSSLKNISGASCIVYIIWNIIFTQFVSWKHNVCPLYNILSDCAATAINTDIQPL